MDQLVTFEKGEALTNTLIIAEGTQNEHASVINLVRKYTSDLEEFGPLRFEIAKGKPLPQGGFAKSTEYALLNEQQATLLLTYMKNTPIIRKFKKSLVRAFFELSREQVFFENSRSVNVNMAHTRGITNPHGLDIRYTLDLTKIVMHPTRTSITILERLAGVPMDDILAEMPTVGLGNPHASVLAFSKERIKESAGARVETAAVYAAYREYCAKEGILPMPMNNFGRSLRLLLPFIEDARGPSAGGHRPRCYANIALAEAKDPLQH